MFKVEDISYFSKLSISTQKMLDDKIFKKSYRQNSIVFYEGDKSGYLYILLDGTVKMYKSTPKGNQIHINHLKAPSLIGEYACFERQPYPATCEFATDGVVGLLPYDVVNELLGEREFTKEIISSLTGKVLLLSALVHKETVLSSEAKVADLLIQKESIFTRLKNSEIASILNLTPETFSRILTKFKKEGLISANKHQLTILDRDRLLNLIDTNKIKECTNCIIQFKKEHGIKV